MPRKGHSGRKRKWDDHPYVVKNREGALEWYYKHHEHALQVRRDYHKKNLDVIKFAAEHGISRPEARKILLEKKKGDTK